MVTLAKGTYSAWGAVPLSRAHLDEIEFVDAELVPDGLRDIEDVVAIGGHDVRMHEVGRDGSLRSNDLRLLVAAATGTGEDHCLDRHL